MRGMRCANAIARAQNTPAGLEVLENPKPAEEPELSTQAVPEKKTVDARVLRSVTFAGPAGRLEGLLNEGAPDAKIAALICHPHPKGGGTMHNKVVYHAMQVLNRRGWGFEFPVLRFNFRGVGLSQGAHDGRAEFVDVLAALDWLEREYARPIVLAGFSFGAAMALHACCHAESGNPPVKAVAALGLPTQAAGRSYGYPFLDRAKLPKLFLSGERDQFAQPEQLEGIVAQAADPKELIFISGADHFFTHQLSAMQQAMAGWLHRIGN